MSNNNYDWIKPKVHAWVDGLVCPVEVEVIEVHLTYTNARVNCGLLTDYVMMDDLHQTEAECLEVMRSKAPNHQN